MLAGITDAQKRAWDFHKSEASARINKIKYNCFFLHGTENTKNFFFSRSKIRNKNSGHVLLDFISLFNIAVEKFGKKNFYVV